MRRKRLLWQLYPSYLFITIISLVAVTWYGTSSFRNFSLRQTAADLEIQGNLEAKEFASYLDPIDRSQIQQQCLEQSAMTGTRITVILSSGQVVGDSDNDPDAMDNHADRPEVIQAFSSGKGESIRYSYTLEKNMMYVAVPIEVAGAIPAVLRLSMPTTLLEEALSEVYNSVILGGLIVAIIAAALSFFISRRISLPLEQMRRGARRFAEGDLKHKLVASPIREVGDLAETMNQMAEQLYERMQTVIRQRNEQEAMLSSMVEGVIAVDTDARLISLNRAAATLFDISDEAAEGRTLHEIIRNASLLEFVDSVLTIRKSGEAELTIFENEEKYLQVHGTVLHDAQGKGIGALFVLNDITRIRRLESVRRDFVANVSHELKTAVTSVKGFVETLLDGAMDDRETAVRFLKIISRHSDRLQAIIEDLLCLSRLEQEEDKRQLTRETSALRAILDSAVQACDLKASEKNITISLDCPANIAVTVNTALLEQAIINLIDNAIKYSDDGGRVRATAAVVGDELQIKIIDEGSGIPREHLNRLFERFYRVDKARSRELGGTGLGLAIVKHIAQIHGGFPSVESAYGRGSTFTVHLPRRVISA